MLARMRVAWSRTASGSATGEGDEHWLCGRWHNEGRRITAGREGGLQALQVWAQQVMPQRCSSARPTGVPVTRPDPLTRRAS